MLNESQVAYFLLAIENLEKEIGDWPAERIIDHLKSNIALARQYMEKVIDENDNISAKGLAPNKAEQVYATIRSGTRYEEQCTGKHFPVRFELSTDGYHWKGGLGGRYRTSDLLLYKNVDGKARQCPTFHGEEYGQLMDIVLTQWEGRANHGRIYPDWFDSYSSELTERLGAIKTKAHETYETVEE